MKNNHILWNLGFIGIKQANINSHRAGPWDRPVTSEAHWYTHTAFVNTTIKQNLSYTCSFMGIVLCFSQVTFQCYYFSFFKAVLCRAFLQWCSRSRCRAGVLNHEVSKRMRQSYTQYSHASDSQRKSPGTSVNWGCLFCQDRTNLNAQTPVIRLFLWSSGNLDF